MEMKKVRNERKKEEIILNRINNHLKFLNGEKEYKERSLRNETEIIIIIQKPSKKIINKQVYIFFIKMKFHSI